MSLIAAHEGKWMARILRVFAVKELFDAVVGLLNWLTSKALPAVSLANMVEHVLLWAFYSLAVAILLFRHASTIAQWLTVRPRMIARALNTGDNLWLSLGTRSVGIWSFVQGAGYFLQGFVFSAAPKNPGGAYSGSYYLTWAFVYLFVGLLLAKRPDFVGVVVTSPETTTK